MRSRIPPIKSHPTADKPLGEYRILVVDDEPAILFAYRKLIEKDGMSVDICATLEDAIRLIRARRYLAVIADLRLAGTDNGDGLEIIRIIQQENPGTKTILATGYSDSKIEKKALELGASYCFKKPVAPSDILEALRAFSMYAICSPVAVSS